MQDLKIPDFLSVNDADDIMKEIFALIPDEYDKSAGQHLYNAVKPTANIVSQLRGFDLPKAIGLIWPKYAWDQYLDWHAELRKITRKAALYASGEVTLTGTPGTVIPAGYIVSTETRNDVYSKDYVTLEECTIGEDGTVTVAAQARTAGAIGNTAANTIVVNTTSFDDVTGITNKAAFKGGIDEEDDASLYERISEYDKSIGDSYTGNPADYKRWAESVTGTGSARVIRATDDSGLVTIVLLDGNEEPASPELCEKVYNYIMSPDDEYARLAPCNAVLSVIPPETLAITVTVNVELKRTTVEDVSLTLLEKLKSYFMEAMNDKEIRYQKVANILGDITGVYDFSELLINGDAKNIPLAGSIYPLINSEDISLTLVT